MKISIRKILENTRCRRVFLPEKFTKTIKRWNLFGPGDRLVVTVSGGIDSVTLLHLFLHLPPSLQPYIVVAHYNHHLRGKQSDEEASFVKDLCQEWKVPFYGGEAPLWKTKSNLHDRARRLRYDFFKKVARQAGTGKIVTAHQADDQAETFLIRWLQGAGLKGLSAISLKRDEDDFTFIRPLLFASRSEIHDYAVSRDLPFREDPSNVSENYLRSRVRKWLQFFRSENPNLGERTSLNSIFLQADQGYLDSLTESLFKEKIVESEGGYEGQVKVYKGLPEALRYRLIQRIIREIKSPRAAFPAEAVLKIDELLLHPSHRKHYDLPERIGLKKEKGMYRIYCKESGE